MKILIADDEFHIRQGLEKLDWNSIGLKICGIAKDGYEAMELAAIHKPEVILSDIRMPMIDGLTMTEAFVRDNPDCAIIYLSGYRDFEYIKKALTIGAFDYLVKPTDPEEILDCCKRAVKLIKEKKIQQVTLREMQEKIKGIQVKEELVCLDEDVSVARLTVKDILEYIEQNFNQDISLSDLSTLFHFNSIYINRMIKKETGYTFLEILNNKRMNMAADLLKRKDLKISEVAIRVGILDQRYFSQVFKKYFGKSPKQYRALMQREGEC